MLYFKSILFLVVLLLVVYGILKLRKYRQAQFQQVLAGLGFQPYRGEIVGSSAEIFQRGQSGFAKGLWSRNINGWLAQLVELRYSINRHHAGTASFTKYVFVFKASDFGLHLPYFRVVGVRYFSAQGEALQLKKEVEVPVNIGRRVLTLEGRQSAVSLLMTPAVGQAVSNSDLCAVATEHWIAIWMCGREPATAELPAFFKSALNLAEALKAAYIG